MLKRSDDPQPHFPLCSGMTCIRPRAPTELRACGSSVASSVRRTPTSSAGSICSLSAWATRASAIRNASARSCVYWFRTSPMRNACSVGCEASTMAAASLSSLPGFAYSGCCCEIVHTAPLTSSTPNASAWDAARIAVFIGEDSFCGGAFNGLSDFFTFSPGISTARPCLDERNKNPSFLIAVRPAQPIRKTVQNFHVPLTNPVLGCRRREPVCSYALVGRHLLHLHPALHQLRSSGLGEVPYPSTYLRVRQRTVRVPRPDVADGVLVVDQPLLSFCRCIGQLYCWPLAWWRLPAFKILSLQGDLDLRAQRSEEHTS